MLIFSDFRIHLFGDLVSPANFATADYHDLGFDDVLDQDLAANDTTVPADDFAAAATSEAAPAGDVVDPWGGSETPIDLTDFTPSGIDYAGDCSHPFEFPRHHRKDEMSQDRSNDATTRRSFLQATATLAVAGNAVLSGCDDTPESEPATWPKMTYRKLGRTGWNASRLIFGCGASLMFRRKDELLSVAFDAGINVFDVGYRGYYRDAEENMAAFLKKVRDDIFLISKARAPLEIEPDAIVTPQQAREAARGWSSRLDDSLRELRVDRVNAYYLMASHNPSLIASEEIYRAFQDAKQAGKVQHLGLSTHRNAEKVLLKAAETGWYDLAMIAITPAGWYDWESKSVLAGSKPMKDLQPLLESVRKTGMGLVGMKAARHISGRIFLPWGNPDAFDGHYDKKYLAEALSPFQRSYAYVLGHGLDVVNADIGNFAHLQENVLAATFSTKYFA